ncbi:hypothetical protein [Lacrimispora sp.]|uniref:hypothetical protein n=1 Tax=Lacrimispora sp. TaxID=2719234 RepID=UPI00285F712D|nr:hypothetical protein [Lacrimispora sp.]MDR7814639.1 hypothetical protein [Lacrimispora sp.]
MVNDLIRLENKGRSTYVYVAGIGLGRAIKGITFNQQVESVNDPTITATIDIKEMLRVLAEVTPEQLEEAKEIIKPYLAGYERTVTEDGNSSMEVLV